MAWGNRWILKTTSDDINISSIGMLHMAYVATQQQFLLEQSLKIKGCLGRQRGDFPLVEKVTIQGLILSIGGAISYELLSGRNLFVVNWQWKPFVVTLDNNCSKQNSKLVNICECILKYANKPGWVLQDLQYTVHVCSCKRMWEADKNIGSGWTTKCLEGSPASLNSWIPSLTMSTTENVALEGHIQDLMGITWNVQNIPILLHSYESFSTCVATNTTRVFSDCSFAC